MAVACSLAAGRLLVRRRLELAWTSSGRAEWRTRPGKVSDLVIATPAAVTTSMHRKVPKTMVDWAPVAAAPASTARCSSRACASRSIWPTTRRMSSINSLPSPPCTILAPASKLVRRASITRFEWASFWAASGSSSSRRRSWAGSSMFRRRFAKTLAIAGTALWYGSREASSPVITKPRWLVSASFSMLNSSPRSASTTWLCVTRSLVWMSELIPRWATIPIRRRRAKARPNPAAIRLPKVHMSLLLRSREGRDARRQRVRDRTDAQEGA